MKDKTQLSSGTVFTIMVTVTVAVFLLACGLAYLGFFLLKAK